MADSFSIERLHGRDAEQARGVAVVIDVLRAFTVAACALAGGARELLLVRTVEEAFAVRSAHFPDALLAGEVDGRMIPGFDLNNSPVMMQSADVRERLIIQRTGAGTQGAVSANNASRLLVAALVNARATAAYATQLAASVDGRRITLVPTANTIEDEGRQAIEDDVCAEYLEALLRGREDAANILADGIARLAANERLGIWTQGWDDFPPGDVTIALAADRFDFAMEGERRTYGAVKSIAVRRVDVE